MARERKCRESGAETSVLFPAPRRSSERGGAGARLAAVLLSLSLRPRSRCSRPSRTPQLPPPRPARAGAPERSDPPRPKLPVPSSSLRGSSEVTRGASFGFATCRHQQPVICPHGNCPCHQRTLASRRPRPSDNKRRNEVGQGSDPLVMRLVASQRVVARPCSHHPARSCRLVVPALKDGA